MHPDDDSSSDDATPLAHIYTHVVLLASELSDLAATRLANSAEVVLAQRQLQVAAFWIAEADRPHPALWSIRPHRATADVEPATGHPDKSQMNGRSYGSHGPAPVAGEAIG